MMIPGRKTGAFLGCLVAHLLAPLPVFAHGIIAECRLKGNQLHVEASFDDGIPARDAKVRVVDERDRSVASGRTNEQGVWTGDAPPAGRYLVIVDAGAGHRTKVPLTVPLQNTVGRSRDGVHQDLDTETVISEGPDRRRFMESRWVKVGIGVGLIGLLGLLVRSGLRHWKSRIVPPTHQGMDESNS